MLYDEDKARKYQQRAASFASTARDTRWPRATRVWAQQQAANQAAWARKRLLINDQVVVDPI